MEYPTKGTPQGGIISPLLANIVLNELDQWFDSQWQDNPVKMWIRDSSIPAEGIAEARPRLERVEADFMGNFKRLGVPSEPMDGRARLALLHSQMHPGSREAFRFSWYFIFFQREK